MASEKMPDGTRRWVAPRINPETGRPDHRENPGADPRRKNKGPGGGKYGAFDQMMIDAEACTLRSQGMTYREIAAEMDCTISVASDRVRRGIAAVPVEAVEAIRQTQLSSLARQKRVVLGVMAQPSFRVDHGKVVMDPLTHQPMIDKEMILKASAELRRLEDSISKLTGTRAPIVHEVHEITEDALDAEINRLASQLGNALERGEAAPAQAAEAGGD